MQNRRERRIRGTGLREERNSEGGRKTEENMIVNVHQRIDVISRVCREHVGREFTKMRMLGPNSMNRY